MCRRVRLRGVPVTSILEVFFGLKRLVRSQGLLTNREKMIRRVVLACALFGAAAFAPHAPRAGAVKMAGAAEDYASMVLRRAAAL